MAAPKATPMFDQYWRLFQRIKGDVDAAIKSNHTYLTINNLVNGEPSIREKTLRFSEFWALNALALHTTLSP